MSLRAARLLVLVLCLTFQSSVSQRSESEITERDLLRADRGLERSSDSTNAIGFLGAPEGFLSTIVSAEEKFSSVRGNPGQPTPIFTRRSECVFARNNSDPCNSQYREISGRCTNDDAGRRTWGMAGTAYTRVLPPKYEDGRGEMRKTEFSSGKPLKSAREISVLVTDTRVELNEDGLSSHIMQWGQFIAHEFTLIVDPIPMKACCPDKVSDVENLSRNEIEDISTEIKSLRPECIPIENFNDPVHGDYHCMRMTRSQPAVLHDCSSNGPREQLNSLSHIFDGSVVYGSNATVAENLRSKTGGKMKVQVVNGVTLPPPANDGACPAERKQNNRCPFAAGDRRINVTPNLISIHAAFLVVHNKIATKLQEINPAWSDERLYQETKKIVSGIESNIHYYEYLPLVVGSSIIRKYRLGSYNGYSSNVNPSIVNELATAGFRLHSLINGIFSLILDNGETERADLEEQFFKFSTIYNGGFKQCIKGLTQDRPWKVDHLFPTQMRDQLFRQKLDIVSFNIARGRDHGFPSYVDYRRHYGLSVPQGWDDLLKTHSKEVRDGLKKAYTNVEDIELYVGGTTENPVRGGIVGELFGNIIADGFQRTRDGDKFFFESLYSGLTARQIDEMRGYTYAHLLCEGADLQSVPDKAFFRTESQGVRSVSCSSLSKLNLDLWRDGPYIPTSTDRPVTLTIPTGPTYPPSTDSPSTCRWRKIGSTRCDCNGSKKTFRRCVGRSTFCRCSGSSIVRTSCTPSTNLCQGGIDSFFDTF